MTLMSWLHSLVTPHAQSDKFDEAIHETDEFTKKVRSLREQIEPYTLDRDPFAAIAKARRFTEEQERRIYQGPPH